MICIFEKKELEKIKKKLLLYGSVLFIGVGISSCEESYKREENQKSLVKEIEYGKKERPNTFNYGSRDGK